MKKQFYTAFVVLFTGIVVLLSCQKEKSCEGCKENNKPPIAVAGLDQVITLPTDSISLDGSASNDPDGTISEWLWANISGPASFNINSPTASRIVVKNLDTGVYRFELMIKDNGGLSAKDTVQITVNSTTPVNRPPMANAGPDQTISLPTNTVNIDGSASTDPDNNITGYTWTKISGPATFTIVNVNSVQTQINNLVEGVYKFELKVTDAGGLFCADTIQVTVNGSTSLNRPPVASAGNDTIVTLPANNAILNGNGSTDPDNNITTYLWTKISGPASINIINANVVQTQITDLVEGIYKFELRVTDAGGLFSIATVHVIVQAAFDANGADVYVAGNCYVNGKPTAVLWHNGVVQNLSDGQYDAGASSVFVHNNDVYVAGYEKNSSGKEIAKYWKNGAAVSLPDDGSLGAWATAIVVSAAGDVYVAGIDFTTYDNWGHPLSVVKYWKNGAPVTLSNYGGASDIAISGNDVYVTGINIGLFWKNDVAQPPIYDGGHAVEFFSSVFVTGSGDVYVTGQYDDGWCCMRSVLVKNGAIQQSMGVAAAWDVYVSDNDVYVVGEGYTGSTYGAAIWKNGLTQNLSTSQISSAKSVFVSGSGDVYVAGYVNNLGTLWKNAVAYYLPVFTANSVFVK
jgi:hypothetical protein